MTAISDRDPDGSTIQIALAPWSGSALRWKAGSGSTDPRNTAKTLNILRRIELKTYAWRSPSMLGGAAPGAAPGTAPAPPIPPIICAILDTGHVLGKHSLLSFITGYIQPSRNNYIKRDIHYPETAVRTVLLPWRGERTHEHHSFCCEGYRKFINVAVSIRQGN